MSSSPQTVDKIKPAGILYNGELSQAKSFDGLSSYLSKKLAHTPVAIKGHNREIKKIAWCTGAGQGFIQQAYESGVDAFISGEISEQTVHQAVELGINYYACGHHATERYGVKALGERLAKKYPDVKVSFVDLYIPV